MSPPEIVLCEDYPALQVSLTAKFRRLGFVVRPFANGEDAWRSIVASPPDLVVTDYGLEGIDGQELCRRLRAAPEVCEIPVILMTGTFDLAQPGGVDEDLAIDRVIFKPFSPNELVGAVQDLLSVVA